MFAIAMKKRALRVVQQFLFLTTFFFQLKEFKIKIKKDRVEVDQKLGHTKIKYRVASMWILCDVEHIDDQCLILCVRDDIACAEIKVLYERYECMHLQESAKIIMKR